MVIKDKENLFGSALFASHFKEKESNGEGNVEKFRRGKRENSKEVIATKILMLTGAAALKNSERWGTHCPEASTGPDFVPEDHLRLEEQRERSERSPYLKWDCCSSHSYSISYETGK